MKLKHPAQGFPMCNLAIIVQKCHLQEKPITLVSSKWISFALVLTRTFKPKCFGSTKFNLIKKWRFVLSKKTGCAGKKQ